MPRLLEQGAEFARVLEHTSPLGSSMLVCNTRRKRWYELRRRSPRPLWCRKRREDSRRREFTRARHGQERPGIHTSGITGGTKYGVAKRCNLIAVVASDDEGEGRNSNGLKGLECVVITTGKTNWDAPKAPPASDPLAYTVGVLISPPQPRTSTFLMGTSHQPEL